MMKQVKGQKLDFHDDLSDTRSMMVSWFVQTEYLNICWTEVPYWQQPVCQKSPEMAFISENLSPTQ